MAGRFYDLRFDSGILSANCADQISASTFGYYDANTSMKLVSFLWNATALRRLLNISSTNPDQLTCDITCLLVMDRRPLPDFSLFHDLMRSGSRPSTATTEFLLARALFTKVKTSPGQIAGTFRRQGNQICVQDRCVDVPDIDAGTDCSHMTERFSSPRSVDEAIGLKAWMLGAGRSAVYDCINMAFREPLEKIQNSFVRSVFDLSVFDPVLTFVDVVSAFRSGLLKNSDFLDENILQLTNLDLSNLQSVSWNFAEAILDQLESEASRERLAQIPMLPNLKSLLEHGTSAARLTVLLCRQEHVSSSERGAICDRRQIYLSAMNEITR